MSQFLLQMHGESGAGKSTLALAIGAATGALVLDKDRIKGPLIDGGLEDMVAGGLTYDVVWLLLHSFLSQGFSVVLDSPAFWPRIIEQGKALGAETAARYYIIECRCDDEREQERRLTSRTRFASQPADLSALSLALTRPGVERELAEPHLSLDTTQPLDACVRQALRYIDHDQG